VSLLCNFLGLLVYALSSTIPGFLVAGAFIATGWSFVSGNREALVYETLLEQGEEASFRRVMGHVVFARFAGEAAASLLGGALALVSLRAPFWGACFRPGWPCSRLSPWRNRTRTNPSKRMRPACGTCSGGRCVASPSSAASFCSTHSFARCA